MRPNLKSLGVWCFLLAAVVSVGWAKTGDQRLIEAVRSQDAALARSLIQEKGIDVNAKQGDGATALHWAAHFDQREIASLLLKAGADAGAANDSGSTPLHLACTNRSAPMVELLLKAGADPNAKLLNGETVLMTCSRTGNAEAVQALLNAGAKVNEKESGHDQTALMWAAAQGHSEVVKLLLGAGADVKARALTYPQTVVPEATQRAGREALNYTVLRGGSTPLLFAARNGDLECARLLLEAGADPNESLPDGTSALVLASHSGHGDVGILLLEKGADPNAFGTGYTALHTAVLRSEVPLIKALLAHGADPNVRMTKGTPMRRQTTDFNLPFTLIGATPYFLAAKFVEAEAMKALVAGGADPKLAMPDGTTPLMAAAGMGSQGRRSRRGIAGIDVGGDIAPETQVLDAVEAAVELGGDINAVSEDGNTALHSAAGQGYDTVAQFLAEHGADLSAKNRRGQTALAIALNPPGRRRRPANDLDDEGPPEVRGSSTAELLRKLGASE